MKTWLLLAAVLAGAEVRPVRTDVSPLGGDSGWRVRSYTPRSAAAAASLPAAPTFFFADDAGYNGYAPYAGLPATDGCKDPATVTGGRGEAITFTRASTRFCPSNEATEPTGTMCASGELCLVNRRLGNFVAATNLALRSEQFDNIVWVYTGTGSVTANAVTAPDGATTADQITGASANSGVTQTIATTTAAKYNISVWARCYTATCSPRLIMTGVGSSAGDATCMLSATTTWKRFSCLSPVAYGAGLTAVAVRVDLGTGDPTTDFWGFMLTNDDEEAVLGPYVATTTVAVARASETINIAWNTAAVAATGSAAYDKYQYAKTTYNRKTGINVSNNGAGRIGYAQYVAGTISLYDGTTECVLDAVPAEPRLTRFAFQWGVSGNMTINNVTDAATKTCAFDGSMPTASSTGLGYSSATLNGNGYISNVCVDADPARCYR